jgi:hypothetical protein
MNTPLDTPNQSTSILEHCHERATRACVRAGGRACDTETERQHAGELDTETERQHAGELDTETERQYAGELGTETERQHAGELDTETETGRQHAGELDTETERQHASSPPPECDSTSAPPPRHLWQLAVAQASPLTHSRGGVNAQTSAPLPRLRALPLSISTEHDAYTHARKAAAATTAPTSSVNRKSSSARATCTPAHPIARSLSRRARANEGERETERERGRERQRERERENAERRWPASAATTIQHTRKRRSA